MSGTLIKIQEVIVTSESSTVTLGGADWDSSYDVYQIIFRKVKGSIDDKHLRIRFLKASDNSPDATSNYDEAAKLLRADTTFSNSSSTDTDHLRTQATGVGNNSGEATNGIYYLFNFNNASEYSYLTNEEVQLSYNGTLWGSQGAGVLTVEQATNGLLFYMNDGNITSGTFTLYGLKN